MSDTVGSHGGDGPVVIVHSGPTEHVTFSKKAGPLHIGAAYTNPELAFTSRHDGDTMEGNDGATKDYIEIIVYFPDKTGVQLKVRDGQNIEAGELFEIVKDVKSLPDDVREVFSLWVVSDLLELQLKPNHVPFKLVCYWEELLEKYTSASEEFQQRDEPVIMFKRNVFYSREEEKNLADTTILGYLYSEAKRNILEGRYPLSRQECDDQAAIQALITAEELNENAETDVTFGSVAYFKSRLAEYLPSHFCRRHWIYKTRENPERRLAEAYTRAAEGHEGSPLKDLYCTYLSICQKKPYYGAAFFRGQAEHPAKGIISKVLSTRDDPVYVAINVDGVFIIDMDDIALLIGFYYESLSWQYVESAKMDTPNCLPCLFLQFPSDKENEKTKLLQIFSREAVLMDNIIEACVVLKKHLHSERSRDECHVIYGHGHLAENFSRLALMGFDDKGQRVSNTVRLPKQKTDVASNTQSA